MEDHYPISNRTDWVCQVRMCSTMRFCLRSPPKIRIDWVSSKGFSYGYIGGGLQFAITLGLVAGGGSIGIGQGLAARLGLGMAGLWWAGFTLFTLKKLKEAEAIEGMPEKYQSQPKIIAYVAIGITRTVATIKKVKRFKHLLLFLIAFMIYNDGIQTVIKYGNDLWD